MYNLLIYKMIMSYENSKIDRNYHNISYFSQTLSIRGGERFVHPFLSLFSTMCGSNI